MLQALLEIKKSFVSLKINKCDHNKDIFNKLIAIFWGKKSPKKLRKKSHSNIIASKDFHCYHDDFSQS